jgi:hypothetical protein
LDARLLRHKACTYIYIVAGHEYQPREELDWDGEFEKVFKIVRVKFREWGEQMTLEEVREYAEALGIQSTMKFYKKEDLIRTIQLAMGKEECFGEAERCACCYCEWQEECKCGFQDREGEKWPA